MLDFAFFSIKQFGKYSQCNTTFNPTFRAVENRAAYATKLCNVLLPRPFSQLM